MVKKIRDRINGNPTIRNIIALVSVAIVSWMALTLVNVPTTYSTKQELKETKIEIKENRTKEIKSLEKLVEVGFKNIETNMIRQERKIDKITDHMMNRGREGG